MKKITNKGKLELELCHCKVEVESNETTVDPIKVEIEQEQPCKNAIENGTIRYVFKIKNKCKTDVEDLVFKDTLDKDVELVRDSVKIDNEKTPYHLHDDTLEVKIKELKGCKTLILSFEVKVHDFECDECKNEIAKFQEKKVTECKCQQRSNFIHVSQL